jgi:hypothetical protein
VNININTPHKGDDDDDNDDDDDDNDDDDNNNNNNNNGQFFLFCLGTPINPGLSQWQPIRHQRNDD